MGLLGFGAAAPTELQLAVSGQPAVTEVVCCIDVPVEALEEFTGRREVGHTGSGSRDLVTALRATITDDELVDAGLAPRNKTTGTVTDFYRDRVLIPIRDPDGRMCAFIGRYVGDGDWGKYMNPTHEHGQVVVVEGTFDADGMQCTVSWTAGFDPNCEVLMERSICGTWTPFPLARLHPGGPDQVP